jgi:hypothetical protein
LILSQFVLFASFVLLLLLSLFSFVLSRCCVLAVAVFVALLVLHFVFIVSAVLCCDGDTFHFRSCCPWLMNMLGLLLPRGAVHGAAV